MITVAYQRQWRKKNPDKVLAYKRRWYRKYKAREDARTARWAKTAAGRKLRARLNKEYKVRLQNEMFAAYGNSCSCCGEHRRPFLTLEHKLRDGGMRRKKRGPMGVLVDLKRRGWPQGDHTILCMNCNFSTRLGDKCPHEIERLSSDSDRLQ